MTPAARMQAAIDILDEVVAAARGQGAAADVIVARYFSTRRYAGSKDRRAVRDLVFAGIRRAGEVPASGRAAMIGLAGDRPELADLFNGAPHCPAPIATDEPVALAAPLPAWLTERLLPVIGADELPALLERAPLDLRANRLKIGRADLLARLPEAVAGSLAPDAFRLPEGTRVEAMPEWNQGLFEVQDEGSQLLAEAVRARPGQMVVDLCAGAGGKTLALAATMANEGRLIACDVDRMRLARLAPRKARAGAEMIEELLLDAGHEDRALGPLGGQADAVLVDAPCSGSGTWRRNPEARWRLTPERLARLSQTQAHVLALGAALVRPGGRLVFAVCSLLPDEGADRIAAFLADNPGWTAEALSLGRASGAGSMLTPARDGTDGFFVASLIRA
ncbi:RsmB/NOP family class I SAM-dependent RNA methyltransferase [Sphingomonas sp. BIUV-7]|uniref:RsmB/NOP family class I SAM-dependent RNA methyltransferase n=1 Tax=Sphingomonas natans TaxID=3063330 RepID=A0ABT8Y9F8_9SPHN|nr:RsmB/NOP family class I SAM-dependent RNA methyltransferase [Sphingomonas sp. BIUV-7]MDO6414967.1 RsmB/NOP family class I SAM-dependent RNA methyltransferase [Sphingomonas sp. BIUV-7]